MTGPQVPAPLPDDVLELVHGPVATMAHVELLLALRAADPRSRTLDALATATHAASVDAARRTLDELAAARLVANPRDGEWIYAPRTASLRAAVDGLARAYDERPVTLVRALYSRPARPRQSFADAFPRRHDA